MDNDKQHPRCFGSRQDYELWLDSPYKNLHPTPAEHCTDCLPSFKMRMSKCARCEHPETVFAFEASSFEGEDGVEISGHWAKHHLQQFQIVRFVKPRGRPRKDASYQPSNPRAKRLAMGINPPAVGIAAKEQSDRKYWEDQERRMRERMALGR